MSDFKSNEYANLIGGDQYEPHEENPMIGFRGASRYLSPRFRECFALECEALRNVRDEMGLTNVKVMIPFVRTVAEARAGPRDLLAEHGLRRGENGLQVIMMCEMPSNAILADEFLEHFDGFSIGSNDMTQLTLGLDRDSGLVAPRSTNATRRSRRCSPWRSSLQGRGKYIGICGQGPATIPTSPSGCSRRASSRCRSIRTPWSRPGRGWAGSRPEAGRGRRRPSRVPVEPPAR